jgi:hypothetical protein
MSRRRYSLTIKNWLGAGTESITFPVAGYSIVERALGQAITYKLFVYRKPDRFSSRLGMMARLNQNTRTLSWGFTEMSLKIEEFSDQGALISGETREFFGVGVTGSRMVGDDEEVLFVSHKKSVFAPSDAVALSN